MPKYNSTLVPKLLFSIWFGEEISEEYKSNIITTIGQNPDYVYHLYSDKTTMMESEWGSMLEFCKKNNIHLIDISDCIDDLMNRNVIMFELNTAKSKQTKATKKIHYARASDNLRLGLLYKNGGVYFESDLVAKKGFGDINPTQQTLLAKNNRIQESLPNIPFRNRYYTLVQYYFIASLPGSHLILTAINATNAMYHHLHESRNPFWMADLSRGLAESYTTATSGFGLVIALNHILQNTPQLQEDAFFLTNIDDYFEPHYGQSWLEDNDVKLTSGQEKNGALLFFKAVQYLNNRFNIQRPAHLTQY